MWSGEGGKISKYYTHWHLAKCIKQPLSERDGLISGRPVPTQTTILASFHCQHLRFESNFSTLRSQFLFPLFFPPYDLSLSKIPVSLSSPTQSELKKYSYREQTQTQKLICTHKNQNRTYIFLSGQHVSTWAHVHKPTNFNYNAGMTSLVQCTLMYGSASIFYFHQQAQGRREEVKVKTATASVSGCCVLGFISQPCQHKHHVVLFVSPKQYLLLLWFCLLKAFIVQHKSKEPWQDIWRMGCGVTFIVCS